MRSRSGPNLCSISSSRSVANIGDGFPEEALLGNHLVMQIAFGDITADSELAKVTRGYPEFSLNTLLMTPMLYNGDCIAICRTKEGIVMST